MWNNSLVVMHDKRRIDYKKPHVCTLGTLEPQERGDILTFDQHEALAVVKADETLIELNETFRSCNLNHFSNPQFRQAR
jgi:hypothetical protein